MTDYAMANRTDIELRKITQKTKYLANTNEQGFQGGETFGLLPYFNMEMSRSIMGELNSLFHPRGGVSFGSKVNDTKLNTLF
jgi:hypothetical protein